jgi:hypothetical protein
MYVISSADWIWLYDCFARTAASVALLTMPGAVLGSNFQNILTTYVPRAVGWVGVGQIDVHRSVQCEQHFVAVQQGSVLLP